MDDMYRVCVKVYAAESTEVRDEAFIPIFHEWIRTRALEVVLIDVADYTHAPDSPGVMLISHEASFALDRADGRFGLLVQRRRPIAGGIDAAIATTLRQAFDVATRLERESRLDGALAFETGVVRVEANDRLRAPNSDEGYDALAPRVRAAGLAVHPGRDVSVTRIANDPRDRLAMELRIGESGAPTPSLHD